MFILCLEYANVIIVTSDANMLCVPVLLDKKAIGTKPPT